MRKALSALTFGALVGSAAAASAAPAGIKCKGLDPKNPLEANCTRDDVLLIDGTDIVQCKPVMEMGMPTTKPDVKNCAVNYPMALERALTVVKEKGGSVPDTQWDQIVIFGLDAALYDVAAPEPHAPLFVREGYKALMSEGVNEVDRIGIPLKPRVPGRPFVGYIMAGGTNAMGDRFKGTLASCGKAQKNDTDAAQDTKALGTCFPSFYNYYDALAQATGSMFGPFLKNPITDATTVKYPLGVVPLNKSSLTSVTNDLTSSKLDFLQPTVWNALLNSRGSILGGATYRDNGNGTWETTKPPAFYGINRPFEGAAATNGNQMLRFTPHDLYLMGMYPANGPDLRPLEYMKVDYSALYRPVQGKFDGQAGPHMGQKTGTAFRVKPDLIDMSGILMANGGARSPAFDDPQNRRTIRQLWVGVMKPDALILDGVAPTGHEKARGDWAKAHIDLIQTARRQFNQYFYMLTGYRGRVTTTWEGDVDDSGYFEFGQPLDDQAIFEAAGGLKALFPGHERIANSVDVQNVLRIEETPGEAGSIKTKAGAPLKIRLDGDASIKFPTNAVTVRMRIPPQGLQGAHALLKIQGLSQPVRIPTTCGNPAREGCDNDEGILLDDGKWHNYSADLSIKELGFTGKSFDSFEFVPSTQRAVGIEIEYIRISNVASSKDQDCTCADVFQCERVTDPSKRKPDGWIDSEDNCKNLYNPDQADGNNDGVGDACEDFDGDNALNACDNCPTLTNSRQVNSDGKGGGDACDGGGSNSSCFLTPDSLGGRMAGGRSAVALGFLAGVMGLIISRRRRKR